MLLLFLFTFAVTNTTPNMERSNEELMIYNKINPYIYKIIKNIYWINVEFLPNIKETHRENLLPNSTTNFHVLSPTKDDELKQLITSSIERIKEKLAEAPYLASAFEELDNVAIFFTAGTAVETLGETESKHIEKLINMLLPKTDLGTGKIVHITVSPHGLKNAYIYTPTTIRHIELKDNNRTEVPCYLLRLIKDEAYMVIFHELLHVILNQSNFDQTKYPPTWYENEKFPISYWEQYTKHTDDSNLKKDYDTSSTQDSGPPTEPASPQSTNEEYQPVEELDWDKISLKNVKSFDNIDYQRVQREKLWKKVWVHPAEVAVILGSLDNSSRFITENMLRLSFGLPLRLLHKGYAPHNAYSEQEMIDKSIYEPCDYINEIFDAVIRNNSNLKLQYQNFLSIMKKKSQSPLTLYDAVALKKWYGLQSAPKKSALEKSVSRESLEEESHVSIDSNLHSQAS